MQVKCFTVNPLLENTYVVYDENSKDAAIIDCGTFSEGEWNLIKTFIIENNLNLKHLLCTHMHFDHIMGNNFVFRDYGLIPECGVDDIPLYQSFDEQIRMFFGPISEKLIKRCTHNSMPKGLNDGEIVSIGQYQFRVIFTPGHTAGGVCFYCESEAILIAGDTLFQGSIGRWDLTGGDYSKLIKSITNRLLTLPSSTKVFCGHGESTTIDYELNHNPYL